MASARPLGALKNHMPMPTLKVIEIEGKGRGLAATQPLRAGEIVLQDSPILIYSAFPLRQKPVPGGNSSCFRYCGHCFKNLDGEKGVGGSTVVACPSCSHPEDGAFCSPRCQSLALASTHTPWVCQALSYLRNCPSLVDHLSDEQQVQSRFLVAAYNLAMLSPSDFQTLLSLDGGETVNGGGDATAAFFVNSLISALPFPQGSLAPSVQLTAALLAKDKRNAFGLMEPFLVNKERSVRAYVIYPIASFFNHDCLPNACRFDYIDTMADHNTDIVVRMIHDVPEGREICLSYFQVNLCYSERQQRLLDDYGFACSCDRCKIEVNWSNQDDEVEDEDMKENDDEEVELDMATSDGENNEIEHDAQDDFPHSYFFLRYMCDTENCGGTLAPLPPSGSVISRVMECNVCGQLKNEDMGHEI
ncbi:hypothetical protein Dimus_005849 [Dionaea muscipula]